MFGEKCEQSHGGVVFVWWNERSFLPCLANLAVEAHSTPLEFAADLSALADGAPTQALARVSRLRGLFVRLQAVGRHGAREYRSEQTLLGLPLVHVNLGPRGYRSGPRPLARGWLAIGDAAIGVVAIGGMAAGGFAFGGMSVGLVSFGGLALGGLALGGVAVGAAAVGGAACGYFAFGGYALGAHVINSLVRDPAALDFFSALPGLGGMLARLPRGG